MNRKLLLSIPSCMLTLLAPLSHAQTLLKEDFTDVRTSNNWYFFNGACLTASNATPGANPGNIPGCTGIKSSYYNENLTGGINGDTTGNQTLPDPGKQGALRFTNGYPGGYSQNGAIISALPYSTANGLNITFATITYRGNTGGNGGGGNNNNISDPGYGLPISANDGADGISFFLLDGATTPTGVGSWGGSLGYTCSNANPNYTGMPAAFLGLGIDEYGNFLNPGDNTASGPGLQANRIGLRGAGSINWNALTANYSSYYPASLASIAVTLPNGGAGTAAQYAVYDTCRTGMIWNYSGVTSSATLSNKSQTTQSILDYTAIPNGYTVLSGVKIGNEYSTGGYARNSGGVAPIYYRLKITPSGLLSLQYSYNGGAYTYVLQNQSLSSVSGSMPGSLYFGFGGSTGGSTNIHEILCFQAAPDTVSSSSSSTNQRQGAQLNTTSQAFFAFYNPNDWTGRVTANALTVSSGGVLNIATTPTWDGSCALTGATVTQCATGLATTAQNPDGRQILTWDGTQGVPFRYSSLSPVQQAALTTLDASLNGGAVAAAGCAPGCRLNYLRGDRTQEVNPFGVGLFRDRDSVLADIVDSSPVWVGPPNAVLPKNWRDRAHPTSSLGNPYPENSGQSYALFKTVEQNRTNVVYVGSNDGMLHGFRAGSVDVTGMLTSAVPNDGIEVMAYVPGSVIASSVTSAASAAAGANNCVSINATPTQVQNIHGAVPLNGAAASCVQASLDYSNTQYGHNYFVDAAPSSGDLFYNNAWHTWVVGTLGYGGAAIYALDVTDPTLVTEGNAGSKVMGEWTPSSLTCANVGNCGNNLGQISGSPLIRRLHNGQWGIIFGNGLNSSSGDAGIYVIVIPQSGVTAPVAATAYYLSAGVAAAGTNNDGISSVAAADLDGDGISDYVYAGDVLGNVWRFDLTDVSASNWAVSSTTPIFNTGGQPITTHVMVAGGVAGQALPQVMVAFGTGQKFPLTNSTAASYKASTQTLYGFWDWNMTAWNALNPSAAYASLSTALESSCVSGVTLQPSNMAAQTVTVASDGSRHIASPTPVIWPTPTSCTSGSNKFGWSVALPGTQEQIIFNPLLFAGAFIVNSIIPAGSNLLSCNIVTDTGVTYAISVLDGAPLPNFFENFSNDTIGNPYNGSGSGAIVTNSQAADQSTTDTWLVMQTFPGQPTPVKINPPNNILGSRVTWKQLR